jgi:hypothetical protein
VHAGDGCEEVRCAGEAAGLRARLPGCAAHLSAATSATSCLSPSSLLVPVSLVDAVRSVSCVGGNRKRVVSGLDEGFK